MLSILQKIHEMRLLYIQGRSQFAVVKLRELVDNEEYAVISPHDHIGKMWTSSRMG
jgi:hypothetical protein